MKTLAAAVLMIAVSAWGQSATQKAADKHLEECRNFLSKVDDSHMWVEGHCVAAYYEEIKPKPHKLKPSVTCAGKECLVSSHIDPCDGWSCTKPVEEFHWSCLGDCGGVPEGTKWEVIPFNAPYPYPDHILQTDVLSQPDKAAGDCFRGNVGHEKQIPCPDKAAVPVEPQDVPVHYMGSGVGPKHICDEGCPWERRIDSKDGAVVKLSDSEYSHLQQLRAAPVEEEKRLAVKYGANPGFDCSGDLSAMRAAGCFADHYEYKGQFLLIDKGGK